MLCSSDQLCEPTDCSPQGSSAHADSPGKNTGVGWPCFSPGDLPDPGIESSSLTPPALAGEFSTNSATWEALVFCGTSVLGRVILAAECLVQKTNPGECLESQKEPALYIQGW